MDDDFTEDYAPHNDRRKGRSVADVLQFWLVTGLILSIALHVGIYVLLNRIQISGFGAEYYRQLLPPSFKVSQVSISREALEDPGEDPMQKAPEETEKQVIDPTEFQQEIDENTVLKREIRMTPQETELTPELVRETLEQDTMVENRDIETLRSQSGDLISDVVEADVSRELASQLSETDRASASQPSLDLAELRENASDASGSPTGGTTGEGFASMQGYSDIDKLLTQSGPLQADTAPLLMSGDVLFDTDEYALKPAAVQSLQKLGQLMRKYADIKFVVEGHTDSFGSEEYNNQLSLLRAESVKQWLVNNMRIDPRRVITRGLGESRLLAPASGTEQEQQINRRVEILMEGGG